MPVKCPQCGAELDPGFKFCDRCGCRQPDRAQASAPNAEDIPSASELTVPDESLQPEPGQYDSRPAAAVGQEGPDNETSPDAGSARQSEEPAEWAAEPGEDELLRLLLQQSSAAQETPVEPVSPRVQPTLSQVEPAMPAATCPHCGHPLDQDGQYCGNCGAMVDRVQVPSARAMEVAYAPTPYPGRAGEGRVSSSVVSRPALVVVQSGARLDLPDHAYEVTIGRSDPANDVYPQVDLDLYGAEDAGVSRWHAKITCQGEQYMLIDTDSSNGTFLNGKQLVPHLSYPLQHGDQIYLGQMHLSFVLE